MDCFICDQPAYSKQGLSDTQIVSCEDCGEYAIDGITIRHRHFYDHSLNVVRTRQWLKDQRAEGRSVPFIGPNLGMYD